MAQPTLLIMLSVGGLLAGFQQGRCDQLVGTDDTRPGFFYKGTPYKGANSRPVLL